MKMGIFGKVFLYTLSFLVIAIATTAVLFAGQLQSFYDNNQKQMLANVFQPLLKSFTEKNREQIQELAVDFYNKNQSFEFLVQLGEEVIYRSPAMDDQLMPHHAFTTAAPSLLDAPQNTGARIGLTFIKEDDTSEKISVYAFSQLAQGNSYDELYAKIATALLIMLSASIVGAILFAKSIANPIKSLAQNTTKMAAQLSVPAPSPRFDEIGMLESDVYEMYEKLKSTISELKLEIARRQELEENQRYFFSAASHELKTPIAAVNALLECMLANIGDYSDHPKYLRECIKMTNSQSRIISEILEIVSLSDGNVRPVMEKINLALLVESILTEHRALAVNKGQMLSVSICESIVCVADKKMLGRAISNVIMNAVQNAPQNAEIRICAHSCQEFTELTITNCKSHIDDNVLKKLFEPFYRCDQARSRAEGRSGLGLTIVKKLLDTMQIPFSLENNGDDVVFRMRL